MKVFLITLLALVMVGCDNFDIKIYKSEIDAHLDICNKNGGIDYFWFKRIEKDVKKSTAVSGAKCNDSALFALDWDDLEED